MTEASSGAGGRLAGRVAIVTGAAQNIGAATAVRLAAEGAAVTVNYHSAGSKQQAEAVVAGIVESGGRAIAVRADVGNEADVAAMVAETVAKLGEPTILANNAATAVAGAPPWHELTAADFDRVLRTNITGSFLCASAVHPFMKRQGRGAIVNMGSVRSPLGHPGNVHYTTTKTALEGMGRVLAREMGVDGVTVNTIIVGAIYTSAESVYGDQAELDRTMIALQSIKRRGQPADIAGVVAFLASPDGDFITGQSIVVDGGWVMR